MNYRGASSQTQVWNAMELLEKRFLRPSMNIVQREETEGENFGTLDLWHNPGRTEH